MMKWMNVWSYCQMDYRSWPSRLENGIQHLKIRCNNAGERIRIRFSNQYGMEELRLEWVQLTVKGAMYPVMLEGQKEISILPGEACCSDVIDTSVLPGDELFIRFFLKAQTVLTSGTVTYSQRELEVIHTCATDGREIPQQDVFSMVRNNNRMCFAFGVSGVDLYISQQEQCIVAFGDSLTQQGFWVDHLKRRLWEEGMKHIAVINRGIGGSRILKGTNPLVDPYERHGVSGVLRFEDDCFAWGNPDLILVSHGINDLITRHAKETDYTYSLEEILAGLERYAQIAHEHHARILIGTLVPLKHSCFYSESLEQERNEINHWIRTQSDYDGVLEFEKALCSGEDSAVLDARYDSGDGLHFNDAGGGAVAEQIDLNRLSGLLGYTK